MKTGMIVRALGMAGVVLTLCAQTAAAEAMYAALFASRCAGMTQDATALAAVLATRNKQADYMVLPQLISREPLGPYVRRGDDSWVDIVRWSFQAMLLAKELNLTKDRVAGERQSTDADVRQLLGTIPGNSRALGLEEDWAYNIIRQVGNYGESFDRNLGAGSPLKFERGVNALWTKGGLMYPLPMRSPQGVIVARLVVPRIAVTIRAFGTG